VRIGYSALSFDVKNKIKASSLTYINLHISLALTLNLNFDSISSS
jgi:hypothetical protein